MEFFTFPLLVHPVETSFSKISIYQRGRMFRPKVSVKVSASTQGLIFWIRPSKLQKIHLVTVVAEEFLSCNCPLKGTPNSSFWQLFCLPLFLLLIFPPNSEKSVYDSIKHNFNDRSLDPHVGRAILWCQVESSLQLDLLIISYSSRNNQVYKIIFNYKVFQMYRKTETM